MTIRNIRFLKHCAPYNSGEVAGFAESTAEFYVSRNAAVYVDFVEEEKVEEMVEEPKEEPEPTLDSFMKRKSEDSPVDKMMKRSPVKKRY